MMSERARAEQPRAEQREPVGQVDNASRSRGQAVMVHAGSMVAGYRIENVLGHGGMGVVYRATQLSLKRSIALKMIFSGKPTSAGRFRLEAEAIARLQHPNIVQIFEIGEHHEQPFFSMEYVGGGSLAAQLKNSLPTVRQAAATVAVLADAIHHAHQRGIIHRDLKPANILLAGIEPSAPASVEADLANATLPLADTSELGETIPVASTKNTLRTDAGAAAQTWIPKITDFGIAKNLQGAPDDPLTVTGDVLGTPSYMAPEQADAVFGEIGPATDIYALGAILYEMLTSRPPFQGKSGMAILAKVMTTPPSPPSAVRSSIPRDLDTICLKCLAKNPRDRYPSADLLAADLNAFLAGAGIHAQRPGLATRLRTYLQLRPTLSLALGVGALAGFGLLVGLLWIDALTIAALVVLCLLVGAGWYGSRLQAALRRSDEERLRAERNAQRLFLLLETTQHLVTVTQTEDLLQILSEATTRLLQAERATIFLVDAQRGELWSKVALGNNVGDIRVPLGQGIAGTVAVSGETLLLDDPYADARFNAEVDRRTGYVTRNLLTLPMMTNTGKILGVFQVLNKREGPFRQEDAEILQALAASAARAVEMRGPNMRH